MLDRALGIDGWMWPSELAFLYQAAQEVPDGATVVEIGSWKGRSTVAICEGLKAKSGVTLWAVDTFAGDAEVLRQLRSAPPDSQSVLAEFRENTQGFDFLRLIVDRSDAAARHFDDKSIDWVFIDADHSYEAVVHDIAVWARKVRTGGLISGHDFGRYGVTEAVLRSFGTVSCSDTIWYTRSRPRPRSVIALRRALRGSRAWFRRAH